MERLSKQSIYFFAGAYGVGKSVLCSHIAKQMRIESFNASDLIKNKSKENLGIVKHVQDVNKNQNILIEEIKKILTTNTEILLAGHFAIFDKEKNIEDIPTYVFEQMPISKIVLLEATLSQLQKNLSCRDSVNYSVSNLENLLRAERQYCQSFCEKYNIPLLIYQMTYTKKDITAIMNFLEVNK